MGMLEFVVQLCFEVLQSVRRGRSQEVEIVYCCQFEVNFSYITSFRLVWVIIIFWFKESLFLFYFMYMIELFLCRCLYMQFMYIISVLWFLNFDLLFKRFVIVIQFFFLYSVRCRFKRSLCRWLLGYFNIWNEYKVLF